MHDEAADGAVVPTRAQGAAGVSCRSRRSRAALWLALTTVLAAAIAAVVLRQPPPSPAEELARVRDFVASAGTGRFEGTSRSESGHGPDHPGSTSIDVSRMDGSFMVPDRVRFVEDSGGDLYEVIVVGGASYFRSGETRSELQGEPWVYEELPEADERARVARAWAEDLDEAGLAAVAGAAGVLGAFGGGWFDLEEMLGNLHKVRRVSPGVLEATLKVRDFLPADIVKVIEQEAAEAQAEAEKAEGETAEGDKSDVDELHDFGVDFLDDPVTVRLVHAGDGRLDEMVVTTESGEGEDRTVDRTQLRFSGWGEPVRIAAPSHDDIDATPGVDEEELAAFRAFPPLAPTAPPPGMLLRGATVTDEDPEFESCASVDLDYGAPLPTAPAAEDSTADDEITPFLRVTLTQASCRWADEAGTTFIADEPVEDIRVGPYTGKHSRLQFPGMTAGEAMEQLRFTAGDVVVDAETNLPLATAVAALATLGPLDLSSQPLERSEPPPS